MEAAVVEGGVERASGHVLDLLRPDSTAVAASVWVRRLDGDSKVWRRNEDGRRCWSERDSGSDNVWCEME